MMSDATPRLTVEPSATSASALARRRPGAARRPAAPRVGRVTSEQRIIDALVLIFVFTLFIPEAIALHLGSVRLLPMFVVAMVLFPLLFMFGRIRWAWPELLIVAMFCSFFLSTVSSSPLLRSIESIGRMFLIAGMPYLIGRYVVQDTHRLTRFLGLLLGLAAILAVLSLAESFARFNIHSVVWNVYYNPHPEKRLGLTRAYGWTTHSIMFGLVNAIFLPILLVAVIEKLRLVGRWPKLKALALGVGCFTSLSTGAWGPAVLSVLFVAWDYLFKVKPVIRWPLTYAAIIGGYYALEVLSNRPLLRILMMDLHLSSPEAWWYRWMLYERVYSVMPGSWWLGHGLVVPEEFQNWAWSIDNNFLVVLMQYGRIGLTLWIGLFAAVLLYGGKAVWGGRDTPYVRFTRAISFGLIGITLTQLSVALFSTPNTLYWLLMGLAIGAAQNCRREAKAIAAAKTRNKMARRRPAGSPPRQTPAATLRAVPSA